MRVADGVAGPQLQDGREPRRVLTVTHISLRQHEVPKPGRDFPSLPPRQEGSTFHTQGQPRFVIT